MGWTREWALPLAAACSVAMAGEGALAELPLADSVRVAAGEYREAAAVAARGGGPLDIALAVAGAFEGRTQHLIQVNEGAEAPTVSRVTVLRDGLLDDSVRGERWDVALERTPAGAWRIVEVRRAWRCWRGGQTDRFAAARCP